MQKGFEILILDSRAPWRGPTSDQAGLVPGPNTHPHGSKPGAGWQQRTEPTQTAVCPGSPTQLPQLLLGSSHAVSALPGLLPTVQRTGPGSKWAGELQLQAWAEGTSECCHIRASPE